MKYSLQCQIGGAMRLGWQSETVVKQRNHKTAFYKRFNLFISISMHYTTSDLCFVICCLFLYFFFSFASLGINLVNGFLYGCGAVSGNANAIVAIFQCGALMQFISFKMLSQLHFVLAWRYQFMHIRSECGAFFMLLTNVRSFLFSPISSNSTNEKPLKSLS